MKFTGTGLNAQQLRELADIVEALRDQQDEVMHDGDPTSITVNGPIDVALFDDPDSIKGQIKFLDAGLPLFHMKKECE